jgi:hypothetical protein
MKLFALPLVVALACAVSGGAWAQGNSGKGGGAPGGPPGLGGFPSPTPAPAPAPAPAPVTTPTFTPSTPMSTPIGAPSGGGAGRTAVGTDPLSTPATPLTPAAGSAPPPDRYRELHGHVHAHLCKAKGCEQYCDGRESAMGADKREVFVKQCRSYCMEKC